MRPSFVRVPLLLLGAALVLLLSACHKGGDKPRVAYVTNGTFSFWNIAQAGAIKAARDLDLELDIRLPTDSAEQDRVVKQLLSLDYAGIALSPISAEHQGPLINEACARTKVILHDSDAPGTKRLCFVGVDNYEAGREAGKQVKLALPEGGKFMLFIGRLSQDNARKRCQGVIDEVFGWTFDPARHTSQDAEISEKGYTLLGIRVDEGQNVEAKRLAEAALQQVPDLGCMIGLFAYNAPACLEALTDAGKRGQVKIVAFDEEDATLQGILDGHIQATISQQPFLYGYESLRILAALIREDRTVLPADGFFRIPLVVVKRDNAATFWKELKAQMASAAPGG